MPVSASELSKHAAPASLWLAIRGFAYDLTSARSFTHGWPEPADFDHPGGSAPLYVLDQAQPTAERRMLKYAGADATELFEQLHPPGTLEQLEDSRKLGPIEGQVRRIEETTPATAREGQDVPRLEQCINLDDMEIAAHELLSPKGWAYCASNNPVCR